MENNKKRVYRFGGKTAEGNGTMRNLLGGKGANLAEMCLLNIPVPAGFTITTECCAEYYALGGGYPDELKAEVADALKAKTGIALDKRKIVIADAIKNVGTYTVTCKLGYEITAPLTVKIEEA